MPGTFDGSNGQRLATVPSRALQNCRRDERYIKPPFSGGEQAPNGSLKYLIESFNQSSVSQLESPRPPNIDVFEPADNRSSLGASHRYTADGCSPVKMAASSMGKPGNGTN